MGGVRHHPGVEVTPLVKLVRNLRDRWLGRFYEGPQPPARLRELAVAFANAHPRATRAQWVEFAAAHGDEAYRSGYVRGAEYVERDAFARPDVPPEVMADALYPDWRWAPAVDLTAPEDPVTDDAEDEHDRARRQVREMRHGGSDGDGT